MKRFINSLFVLLALSFTALSFSCNVNPEEEDIFSGLELKSSEGRVITFGMKGDFGTYLDSSASSSKSMVPVFKGTYTVDEENSVVTFCTTTIFFKEMTIGDKKFFGHSYTREKLKDYFSGDYLDFLNYMIQTYPDESDDYKEEKLKIQGNIMESPYYKRYYDDYFEDMVFKYSKNEDGQYVFNWISHEKEYAGSYEDDGVVIGAISVANGIIGVQGYNMTAWNWGDSYLCVKSGSYDKDKKTISFVFNDDDSVTYNATIDSGAMSRTIVIEFKSDAGFLAGQTVTLYRYTLDEESVSDITLTEDDFRSIVQSYIFMTKEDDSKKYYLINSKGNFDESNLYVSLEFTESGAAIVNMKEPFFDDWEHVPVEEFENVDEEIIFDL